MVISTKVLLIIIKYINIGVFLAPKEAQEILNVKLQLLITFFYLTVIAEHWRAQDDGMRDEDHSHQQEAVHTEVLKLLPPGPDDLLSHAGQKNLGMLEI